MNDPILILTVALIAGILTFLWWRAEREERRGYLKRRPSTLDCQNAGREALRQAYAILLDHHRTSTIGTAEAIVAKAQKNAKRKP